MTSMLPFALAVLLAAPPAVPAAAPPASAATVQDARSLRWDAVRVRARLDADGRLHVRERQVMVFYGDWNGGERRFRTRQGQRLRVEGVWRVDPETGELRPLSADEDLDDVDEYDRSDGRLRWRSRLPDDPSFDGERIEYVIDFTLSNAVVAVDPAAGRYRLEHDFLFTDRDGPVERFELELALDPVWEAAEALPGRWDAGPIPPGNGFALDTFLRYRAGGVPASVPVSPPGWLRAALVIALTGGAGLMAWRLFRTERDAGRYDPLPDVAGPEWIETHVLRYPPEVVGAAWDGSTAAPEVAGLLARLVQEGKLASRVEPGDDDPVLHLELKVPRDAFDDTERPLIDALFFDGRRATDTETVREHYEDQGFDPAKTIRAGLDRRITALPGHGKRPRRVRGPVAALVAAVALLVAAVVARPTDAAAAALAATFALVPGLFAIGLAGTYARSVVRLRGLAAGFLVPAAVLVAGLAAFMAGALETTDPTSGLSAYYRPGPVLLVALAALGLGLLALAFRVARPVETDERLALRRRLAAAQAWFRAQLERPDPELRDEWFPWILAFGLGPHVDRWFSAHGPAPRAGTGSAGAAGFMGAAATGGGGGGWTGGGHAFGGGGGFAGGGVGGSWAVAAASVASGVASPSSSGTSGGSVSSGGGGGGGW